MKRVLLFLLTNFAILLVASATLRLLGVEPWLNERGINFTSLLIFGAVLIIMMVFRPGGFITKVRKSYRFNGSGESL